MNQLVVGVNGTIGSSLFTTLEAGYSHIYGTTQRPQSVTQNVFYLDLLAPASWQLPNIAFDVVYLCAGICRMAACEEDPIKTHLVNVASMKELASYFSAQGAFIVYLSTNQVFSGNEPFVLTDHPYQPNNEYGKQKVIIEKLIKQHCPEWAIVRLTKVIEPNMQLICTWINELKQNKSIDALHDMMLAPVTLKQVVNVLIQVGQMKKKGCYHVSGLEDISYHFLACYLAKTLNKPMSLIKALAGSEKGIKKTFLPTFTTLNCSSTISLCGENPQSYTQVLHESFDFI